MSEIPKLRLFVGAAVPRGHLEAVADEVAELRKRWPEGRWMKVENQHVTLKFLGSTPADRLDEVKQACSIVARSRAPATVSLTYVGSFPSRTRVRVLWVGFDDPAELLAGLAKDLEAAFEPLGYAAEKRGYTPHLTLARFKVPEKIPGGLPEILLSGLDPFVVEGVNLYRSHLHPKGARYEVLESFPLSAAQST